MDSWMFGLLVGGRKSVALPGLGNLGGGNPGRRSQTRFAPGYCRSGFQPFEFQVVLG